MNRWRVFLLTIAAVLIISYASIYSFGASRLYCKYTNSIADIAPCYKYDVHDVDADVLLVGDSALLYSIRPSEVTAAGGPSVYNYGLVGPAFAFNPSAVIDRYLKDNRRPRAIVLYFSPWDRIEPGRMNDPRWFPSAVLALQHGGVGDFARLFRARPSAIAEIPPILVRSITSDPAIARSRRLAMEADGGHLDFAGLSDGPTQSLEGRCPPLTGAPVAPGLTDRMGRTLASLRDRYERTNIPVLIYVAPSAQCDVGIKAILRAYAGVADNRPIALPDRFFTSDSSHQHTHVTAEGAILSSQLLARFLRAKLPGLAAQ